MCSKVVTMNNSAAVFMKNILKSHLVDPKRPLTKLLNIFQRFYAMNFANFRETVSICWGSSEAYTRSERINPCCRIISALEWCYLHFTQHVLHCILWCEFDKLNKLWWSYFKKETISDKVWVIIDGTVCGGRLLCIQVKLKTNQNFLCNTKTSLKLTTNARQNKNYNKYIFYNNPVFLWRAVVFGLENIWLSFCWSLFEEPLNTQRGLVHSCSPIESLYSSTQTLEKPNKAVSEWINKE